MGALPPWVGGEAAVRKLGLRTMLSWSFNVGGGAAGLVVGARGTTAAFRSQGLYAPLLGRQDILATNVVRPSVVLGFRRVVRSIAESSGGVHGHCQGGEGAGMSVPKWP